MFKYVLHLMCKNSSLLCFIFDEYALWVMKNKKSSISDYLNFILFQVGVNYFSHSVNTVHLSV